MWLAFGCSAHRLFYPKNKSLLGEFNQRKGLVRVSGYETVANGTQRQQRGREEREREKGKLVEITPFLRRRRLQTSHSSCRPPQAALGSSGLDCDQCVGLWWQQSHFGKADADSTLSKCDLACFGLVFFLASARPASLLLAIFPN